MKIILYLLSRNPETTFVKFDKILLQFVMYIKLNLKIEVVFQGYGNDNVYLIYMEFL